MLLSDKYTIYGDFDLKDNLCEYFNCKNIIFDIITSEDDDIPLIDKILYKSDKNKKILLIIDILTIKKLYQQVSKYNNFLNLIDDGRIKLIYYGPDSILISFTEREIFRKIKLTWLEDCFVGKDIKEQFKNIEFHQLHHPFLNHYHYHHYSNMKNKEIKKKNTFFSLMRFKIGDKRKHRYLLSQKMKGKDYLKDAITKTHERSMVDKDDDPLFFKDLESEYSKIFLDQATWKDAIPVISYYENTCFELVTETLGGIDQLHLDAVKLSGVTGDGDDSFFLTEKTIKPIAMGHPFIILSTKHFLKNLRRLGFKTFGDFIDESYDECDNVNDRVEIISKELERLNITESKKFYNDTRAICEYNQNHLMYLHGRYKFDLWKNLDELFKKYQ
jgi:hypothetical protein